MAKARSAIPAYYILFLLAFVSRFNLAVGQTAKPLTERLSYKIYYHWHVIWLESGEVNFSISKKDYYGIPCNYAFAEGHTYPKYDWFYKVRDTVSTYIDSASSLPMRSIRSSHEGPTDIYNDNVFDKIHHQVWYLRKDKKNNWHRDSLAVPVSTFDVLSGMYYTRRINFGNKGSKDTLRLKIYLDGKVYNVGVRYTGKETISNSFGKFRCEKLSVSLIGGTIFREGEHMTVWATDDANHMPLRVEAPIMVGSVRAELNSFSGLRYPMDAKVK